MPGGTRRRAAFLCCAQHGWRIGGGGRPFRARGDPGLAVERTSRSLRVPVIRLAGKVE